MFIRPQRYRVVLAFILGLSVSIAFLIGGYFLYQSNLSRVKTDLKVSLKQEAVDEYLQNNPVGLVYVFQKEKKAGEIIADTDLSPVEVSQKALPQDAIATLDGAVGKVVRCNVSLNTPVTQSIIYSEGDYPDDLRVMEYTVINLPQKLDVSNALDIRIMFPNGLDYIVLSKKTVVDYLKGENGQPSTLWLHVSEEEILRMSSAIVDASLIEGSTLYAARYVAPDIQKEAAKTYPANLEVLELIKTNPNVVQNAISALEDRNRRVFEDRINQEMADTGKNKVYGKDLPGVPQSAQPSATPTPQPSATPPPATPTPTPSNQPGDPVVDGRL